MKTFTATQLNKSAKEVFRAADKDGKVYIEHDRYPEIRFALTPEVIPRDDPYQFDRVSESTWEDK